MIIYGKDEFKKISDMYDNWVHLRYPLYGAQNGHSEEETMKMIEEANKDIFADLELYHVVLNANGYLILENGGVILYYFLKLTDKPAAANLYKTAKDQNKSTQGKRLTGSI
jgi:hypothetical protein